MQVLAQHRESHARFEHERVQLTPALQLAQVLQPLQHNHTACCANTSKLKTRLSRTNEQQRKSNDSENENQQTTAQTLIVLVVVKVRTEAAAA